MSSIDVSDEVKALFPDAILCVLQVTGARNSAIVPAPIIQALSASEERLRDRFHGEPAQSHSSIAIWRDAYRRFGSNPKKNKPTIEALTRRVLSRKPLPEISSIVNAYLVIELEFLVPCGGYDLGLLNGPLVLRTSSGGEGFRPLGAGVNDVESTSSGEVVYADSKRVLTRHWNHRDSEDTKISVDTTDFVLVFEVLTDVLSADECEDLVTRAKSLIATACGGESQHELIRL